MFRSLFHETQLSTMPSSHDHNTIVSSSPRSSSSSLRIEEGIILPPAPDEPSATPAPSIPVTALPHASKLIPALIIPCSILGVLIRLGLKYIATFPGQQVFSLIWAQFVGCLLMGLFVSTRAWIEGSGKDIRRQQIGPIIYVGLTSGLCGSITTFSSWSLGMFEELINPTKIWRHPLQNILSALSELLVTLAMSITGLQSGMHLGNALMPLKKPDQSGHKEKTSRRSNITVNNNHSTFHSSKDTPAQSTSKRTAYTEWTATYYIITGFGLCTWAAVIVACIWMPEQTRASWRELVLACCLAPPGAILRWYLSQFNPRIRHFPIGTFSANILGSLILAGAVCLQYSPAVVRTTVGCQIIGGIQDGLCGCLTTISTFALELKSLPRKATYIYGTISVVIAQLGMLVILGSFVWTRPGQNFKELSCS
ncbi:MAG: CrcB-like protein-domain-containing protein [Podila humilis]|nr:MAG: CrcB-like protein-domain-containing protein [Podila humilis]